MSDKEITGFFVPFPPDVIDVVREALTELGYDPDASGLRDFIMDELIETDEENEEPEKETVKKPGENISKLLDEHPELVEKGTQIIGNLINKGVQNLSNAVKSKKK